MQIELPKTGVCRAALPRLTRFRITGTLPHAVLVLAGAITVTCEGVELVLRWMFPSIRPDSSIIPCTNVLYIGKNQEKSYPS